MALEETVQVLIGAAVEAEDVLPGVAHQENLHGGVYLKQEVEDPVIKLRQVLGLVNDQYGDLPLEPCAELRLAEFFNELGQYVIDGDDVVAALEFRDEIAEPGIV